MDIGRFFVVSLFKLIKNASPDADKSVFVKIMLSVGIIRPCLLKLFIFKHSEETIFKHRADFKRSDVRSVLVFGKVIETERNKIEECTEIGKENQKHY